jgi:hypothetical protein
MELKLINVIGGLLVLGGIVYLVYTRYNTEWICKHSGGTFWKVRSVCVLPTSDVGKECSDSSECESYCIAPGGVEVGTKAYGKCLERTDANCIKEVENGIVQKQWCKENIVD